MENKLIEVFPYKLFYVSDDIYLYTSKTGAIYKIDDTIQNILNFNGCYVNYSDISENEYDKFIDMLEQCNVIKGKLNTFARNYNLTINNINSITLMINENCNLRCTYCYENYNFDKYKGKMEKEISEAAVDFLSNNKFGITVSVDGDKESHNANRIYKDGKGSYDDMVRGCALLNVHTLNKVARSTISPSNISMVKAMDSIIKIGFDNVFLSEAINMFRDIEDIEQLKLQYDELVHNFKLNLSDNNYQKCLKNTLVMKILRRVANFRTKLSFCDSLIKSLTIDTCGNIYPCHRFASDKNYKIGDIYVGVDEQIYNSFLVNEFMLVSREKCQVCWVQNICGGGCSYENEKITGKCNIPSNLKCEIMEKLVENIIYVYIGLTYEEKQILELH